MRYGKHNKYMSKVLLVSVSIICCRIINSFNYEFDFKEPLRTFHNLLSLDLALMLMFESHYQLDSSTLQWKGKRHGQNENLGYIAQVANVWHCLPKA